MDSRRSTISVALIALICFFLPWVQLSCGKSESRLSGVDLARDGHSELWLIPFLMLLVMVIATARAWNDRRELSGLIGVIAGLVGAYLMNRERVRAEDTSALVAVGVTGWFWLGLGALIAVSIVSALRFLKRPKPG
jgi:ABC-type transport system involved in multi-copper enzyme maturation permease subunit